MKKAVSLLLALVLAVSVISSCAAPAGNTEPSSSPVQHTIQKGKDTPCTDAELTAAIADISAGGSEFSELMCKACICDQAIFPEDVLNCLYEHIGEYKFFKFDGMDCFGEDFSRVLEENPDLIATVQAVFKLHGYTPATVGDAAAVTPEELTKLTAKNDQYLIDATKYLTPEQWPEFLPYFWNGEYKVLDEALGVTLTAVPEITQVGGDAISRCFLITNTSDKTVSRTINVRYDEECNTYLCKTKSGPLLAATDISPDTGSYTLFVKLSDGALMCAQHEGWLTGYMDGVFYTASDSFILDSLTFEPEQQQYVDMEVRA